MVGGIVRLSSGAVYEANTNRTGKMKLTDARAAARAWVQSQKDVADPDQLENELTRALSGLLPEDPGIRALTDEETPRLAIMAGGNLFVVAGSMRDESGPQATCERIPLLPERVRLRVTQDWVPGQNGQGTTGAIRRRWELLVDAVGPVTFEGLDRVLGWMEKGPDDGERLGRAVAEKLGWDIGSGDW